MDELDWPFLGTEALADKTIPERAMRTLYQSVYPGVYAPWGIELTARQRAKAAWLWSRRRGVVAGNSAAALLGAKWVGAELDAELVHDNHKAPPRERDIDRQVALAALGWVVIRVSSELLRYREATLIGRVDGAMSAAGWPGRGANRNLPTPFQRVAS